MDIDFSDSEASQEFRYVSVISFKFLRIVDRSVNRQFKKTCAVVKVW